jgi:hypothetical protein
MLVHWGKISRGAYICDEQWTAWVALERSVFGPLLASRPMPARVRSVRSRLADLVASGLVLERLGLLALAVAALVAAISMAAPG